MKAADTDRPKTIAVILVAAGLGRRFGADLPKQYVEIAGQAIIRRSAEACLAARGITALLPVINEADLGLYDRAMSGLSDIRIRPPVPGGRTRAESVRAGLEALAGDPPDLVLIHDAARPFVSAAIIARIVAALDDADGAFAALPVVDALWRVKHGIAERPVSREGLWRGQTPQAFRFDAILNAHRTHDVQAADDVAVALEAGLRTVAVEGDERNFKITSPSDLDRAIATLEGNWDAWPTSE